MNTQNKSDVSNPIIKAWSLICESDQCKTGTPVKEIVKREISPLKQSMWPQTIANRLYNQFLLNQQFSTTCAIIQTHFKYKKKEQVEQINYYTACRTKGNIIDMTSDFKKADWNMSC